MEESNEQGMFTLENPNRYPEGKGPIPIKILEGRSPEGFDWNCPRDEVWISQGKHSLIIGYTFQFS